MRIRVIGHEIFGSANIYHLIKNVRHASVWKSKPGPVPSPGPTSQGVPHAQLTPDPRNSGAASAA